MTGEHLSADILALLAFLHEYEVRYLIIGGEAVVFHGYPRLTGDVDLLYEPTPANAKRLYGALEEFWGGDVPAVQSAAELATPGIVVQFGRPPNRVDLISSVGPLRFADAWRRRAKDQVRGGRAFPIHYIGFEDLLTIKRDAGRHKDLDDVEQLQRIAQSRTSAKERRPKKRR